VASLSTWECGSYLYGPQKLEVHLHLTEPEHEAAKVARVDQRVRARSSLSPGEGKFRCGRIESAHCNYLSVVRLTGEESSTHVLPDLEGQDHSYSEE
jgi:hypothetical protein